MSEIIELKDICVMTAGEDVNDDYFPEEEINDFDFPTRAVVTRDFRNKVPVGIARNFRAEEGKVYCDALLWLDEEELDDDATLAVELTSQYKEGEKTHTDLLLKSLSIVMNPADKELKGNIKESIQ